MPQTSPHTRIHQLLAQQASRQPDAVLLYEEGGGILSYAQCWRRVQDVAAWLDLQLVTGPLTEGTMTGENWGHLATATAVWVGLPMAIGTYRILTREVK